MRSDDALGSRIDVVPDDLESVGSVTMPASVVVTILAGILTITSTTLVVEISTF